MNFYKRFMGDYQRDTGHLSLAEHGAYTLLLDHYYSTHAPLPEDLTALYRLCRAMTKGEQSAVKSVAEQFFPVEDDGLRHCARADIELSRWEAKAEANREAGKRGGRPKQKPTKNPNAFQAETQTVSETEPMHNPLQKPETRKKERLRNLSPHAESDFAEIRAAYPARDGAQRWADAEASYHARLREGHSHESILAGVKRYALAMADRGQVGSKFVQQAATFLGKNRGFLEVHGLEVSESPEAPETLPDGSENPVVVVRGKAVRKYIVGPAGQIGTNAEALSWE